MIDSLSRPTLRSLSPLKSGFESKLERARNRRNGAVTTPISRLGAHLIRFATRSHRKRLDFNSVLDDRKL